MSQRGMPDDYVDVAERLKQFYEKYPNGRITRHGSPEIREVGNKTFVIYTALAYRDPDDPQPCTGTAWEPFPGPTPFTRDSELMNAETAAWGRAIVAAGIPSKKIASHQEVQSRQGNDAPARNAPSRQEPKPDVPTDDVWLGATVKMISDAGLKRPDVVNGLATIGVDLPEGAHLKKALGALDQQKRQMFQSWLTSQMNQDTPIADPQPELAATA